MDRSAITSALKIAKSIVTSHGISAYLSQHMRSVAARPVEPADTGFRLDYVLDPSRSPWNDNPGCSIHVSYDPDPKGTVKSADGGLVHDYRLSIKVRVGSDDTTIKKMREREAMVSNLSMLCDMLEATLPPVATAFIMTAEQHRDKTKLEAEQLVGGLIHESIGSHSLKGLRTGGTSRFFRLPDMTPPPPDGTYRYTHVRKRNSRGRAVDMAKYVIKVHGASCSVRREE
jgi:hypothetical protein